jgi:hypothetical protein
MLQHCQQQLHSHYLVHAVLAEPQLGVMMMCWQRCGRTCLKDDLGGLWVHLDVELLHRPSVAHLAAASRPTRKSVL